MIYLVPGPKPTNLTLIFSLPHSREIKSVCVAGTFNDFSESATPLRQSVANGPWEASVTVPRKSEVLFRYVINEHKRQFDPDVPATRNNPNGLTFSFITADLAPGQSSAPSSTASDAQLLLQMAPASLKNPKKRIALAESMLKQALKPELDPQDRLNLLQQAVSLDPFNTQIRLALGQVLQGKNALLVASTDLSHFYSLEAANKLDASMLSQIASFSAEGVMKAENRGSGFACGAPAVAVVLHAARALGADTVTILNHSTSGEVTGDNSSVVGYGAAAIYKKDLD